MRRDRKFSKRYQRWLAQNPPKFWPFEWMQVALTFFLIGFGIVAIIQVLPERGEVDAEAFAQENKMETQAAEAKKANLDKSMPSSGRQAFATNTGLPPAQAVLPADKAGRKVPLWKDATEFHKTDWFEMQQAKDDFAIQNFPGSPYAQAVSKMRSQKELVKMPTRVEASTAENAEPHNINANSSSAAAKTPRLISHGLYYHYTDHLGSSNIVTDEAGNIVEATDFYPYGKPRIQQTSDPAFTNKKQFTGKEKDESGLTYFGARYYDEKLGRFTQPDPVALFEALIKNPRENPYFYLNNPQGLNLYAYALNNPLTYIDPNGKFFEEVSNYFAYGVYVNDAKIIEFERIAATIHESPDKAYLVSEDFVKYDRHRSLAISRIKIFEGGVCILCGDYEEEISYIENRYKNVDIDSLSDEELIAFRDYINEVNAEITMNLAGFVNISGGQKIIDLVRGKAYREIPTNLLHETWDTILKLAKKGEKDARKVKKLIEQAEKYAEKFNQGKKVN